MPDRHSELPAHPDLEYYRKQAKHLLRSYEAGDAAARDRAAEGLGDRAAGRFLLSDAQFVLAQEHGFRTWAEFRADIQSQRTTGDRPVSRLWGMGPGHYGPAWSGRSCPCSRRWSACLWTVAPIRPAAARWFPSAPRAWWPCSSPPTGTTP